MSRLKVNKVDHFIESYIIDSDGVVVECGFINDGCVQLNTSNFEWIAFNRDNLFELIKLIDEAEVAFKTTQDDL
tara:strand:- start:3178 stop:3399 length:222 start_codon:yes stop_codon:yes gene_type:complete